MGKYFANLLMIFFLANSFLFSQEGTIRGTVHDAKNNKPLPGVNIILSKETLSPQVYKAMITGQDGGFSFNDIPLGKYTIITSHVGYSTSEKLIDLNNQQISLTINLQQQMIDLGEIVVSSLHQDKRIKNVSMPIEVMNKEETEELAGFSPAEILESEPGVTLKDDGAWATSINIRGMNEKRIVALVDGNRIETATDIAGGLSMIDMSELERVEIIKGASSSLYGTDAMGGVVNFITKKGHFTSTPYTKGVLQSEFQTVNEMYAQKFAVEGGAGFGHFRIGGRIRNAADIKTPEGILPNSQFKDNNISLNIGLKPIEDHTLDFQFQRFLAEDVGIPGGDPFPSQAKATYPEEERTLWSAKYKVENMLPDLNILSVKYYHHYILRDVLLEPNITKTAGGIRTTPVKTTPTGNHYTDGIQLKTNWELADNHNLIGGVDVWQRRLKTKREKHIRQEILGSDGDPVDTINIVRGETPIPESRFASAGLFLQDEFYMFEENLKVTIGGRYDFVNVQSEKAVDPEYLIKNGKRIENPPSQVVTFPEQDVNNKSWSANLGILYSLTDNLDFTLTGGRSFRSPSIEERYKYIDLGNLVRVGDPELSPEEGYTFDAGLRVWDSDFTLKANGYLNNFNNLVVEQPGQYIKEYESGTMDTVDALINKNVNKARIYGFDMQLSYMPTGNFVIHGSASFVRGQDIKNNTNLPLIPPLNGRLGIKYNIQKVGSINLSSVIYDEQNRVAEDEEKTNGYVLYGLSFVSKDFYFKQGSFKIYGGVENILDEKYRNHLSTNRGTLDLQPGRNFYIKLKLKF